MEFYRQEEADIFDRRAHRWTVAAYVFAILAFLGCIVCCCLSSTATASQMNLITIVLSTLGGWFVIFALTARILPYRRFSQHIRSTLEGERVAHTGIITLEPQVLQIPKSIAICKVVVGSGFRPPRLSIRWDMAKHLKAYNGKALTVYAVHGYIAAFEEAHEDC